jgi:serine/threonine protein kinase
MIGKVLRGASGNTYRIDRLLGTGGQGDAYLGTASNRATVVVKLFRDRSNTTIERVRGLASLPLSAGKRAIARPLDQIDGEFTGYVCTYFSGTTLSDLLSDSSGRIAQIGLIQSLIAASVVSHLVDTIHQAGVCHGDLHDGQVLVDMGKPTHVEAALIDLDNYGRPGSVPDSNMAGCPGWMAPEILEAVLTSRRPKHSQESDLWSLGALVSTLLLLRTPVPHHLDPVTQQFLETLRQGWLDDPKNPCRVSLAGGRRSAILDQALVVSLRSSMGREPSVRAGAASLRDACLVASGRVDRCTRCAEEFVAHADRDRCPNPDCGAKFPVLVVRCPLGGRLQANGSIGRAAIAPNDRRVSESHLVFANRGSFVELEVVGRNAAHVSNGGSWITAPTGTRLRIRAGQRCRVFEHELVIESVV